MLGYIKTIADFLDDDNDSIVNQLIEIYPGSSESQILAWKTLVNDLKASIKKSNITRDAVIAIEYALPTSGMGIDVLICGFDKDNNKICYIIESKQWNDDYITTRIFSNYREDERELHPQIQVYRHSLSFKEYTDCGYNFDVSSFVFIRNCSQSGITELIAKNPIPSTKNIPIYNQLDRIITIISASLINGTENMIEELQQASYKPSKDIISAMESILNHEEPFVLTNEQVDAITKIKNNIKNGKRIIRVTGAAGSGKTAILLNLYIELLNSKDLGNDVRPIFVSGAQNTAFYKNKYPQIESSFEYSFSLRKVIAPTCGNKYIVLMDEAQHNQSGIITDVLNRGATLIVCYDITQVINANNAVQELKNIEQRDDFFSIELTSSVRYNGSQIAEKNIRNYLKGNNSFEEDALFDFRVFNDFKSSQTAITATIKQNPHSTFAVTGLLCNDSKNYTTENNPNSILYTNWGYKSECSWLPYVHKKDYFNSSPNLWVGTWWMPGLDVDYTAVIVGGDAIRTSQGIIGNPQQSKHYQMIISVAEKLEFPSNLFVQKSNGYKKTTDNYNSTKNILDYIEKPENSSQKEKFIKLFSQLLRNNYYIMMTRAHKGCFVYFANDTTKGENV